MQYGLKLSIICLAYNQVRFIRDALEGFVRQKTNFPFEVIIHDDASTDGTTEIIKEYEHKYPNIIKPIYQMENKWSKGKDLIKSFIYPHIRGEYVALCEGDDYWTDENKLQKQVDFLDSHLDYTICFHPVKVIWEDKRAEETIFPDEKLLRKTGNLDFFSLLKGNFIQTNSVIYRWRFHKDSYDLIPDNILPGDWFLHLLHAQIGKIGFINEVMGVYRRNAGGIWTGAGQTDVWYERCGASVIRFNEAVEKHFEISRYKEIRKMFIQTYNAAINLKNKELIKYLQKTYPQILSGIKKEKYVATKIKMYALINVLTVKIFRRKIIRKLERLIMIQNIIKE